MTDVPNDWNEPDFQNTSKCHDWKNYVTVNVAGSWDTLKNFQKKAIAQCLQSIVDREEWE